MLVLLDLMGWLGGAMVAGGYIMVSRQGFATAGLPQRHLVGVRCPLTDGRAHPAASRGDAGVVSKADLCGAA